MTSLSDAKTNQFWTDVECERPPVLYTGPSPGTVVGGVYRILGHLGSGAMGVVLLAEDQSLKRQVAVKFIHQHLLKTNLKERFREEARAMARVNHPNVLQIHAFGEHHGTPYFVMDVVQGPTMQEWLAKSSTLPSLELALNMLCSTCDGVAAIHAANTVHRDLKPSNILLDAYLRPRVADLGLSIFCEPNSPNEKERVGTPHYMAPEIAFPGDLDPALQSRADVYSLGCIAYELFTGRPPFEGKDTMGVLVQHASSAVVPPSRWRLELPDEIDRILLQALAKDPYDRTPTVHDLGRELEAARVHAGDPTRILMADDNADFREILALGLRAGFPYADIECVPDGQAALEAFDRKRPSVAIFDLRMPGLDGMQLTQVLRTRVSSVAMPIIVLTASGGPEEWQRLSALGADRFLVKPVALADVIALVRSLLGTEITNPQRRRPSWQTASERPQ